MSSSERSPQPIMDHSKDDPEEKALRQSLTQLDIQKKSMELEADTIYLELTTPPAEGVEPMGVATPLVDKDGYPRGDIDLYRARELRQRFHVLQTDHKEIEGKIQTLLEQLAIMKNPRKKQDEEKEQQARLATKPKPKFDPVTGKWVVMNWDGSVAGIKDGDKRSFENLDRQVSGLTADDDNSFVTASSSGPNSQTNSVRSDGAVAAAAGHHHHHRDNVTIPKPFAKVDAVAAGSPAAEAGLKEDDLIVTFGHLHSGNHNHLKAIAELVPAAAADQKDITIHLQRHYTDETDSITLVPKPWHGRGLLGCHIVPYTPPS